MPVVAADIVTRLSGGAANTSALTSLGGTISSAVQPAALFDDVSAAQSTTGVVEYRCVYVRNGNASVALEDARAWLSANITSAGVTVEIGLGTSAVNGVEQTVANESAAPAGVTFGPAATKAAGVVLGTLAAGQHRAVWIRRTVAAGAALANASENSIKLRTEGETLK